MAAPPNAPYATSQNGSSQEKTQAPNPSTGYCSRCVRICIKCQHGAYPQQSGYPPHLLPPNSVVAQQQQQQQQQQQHPVTCQCSGRSLPACTNSGHNAFHGSSSIQIERLAALAFDQPAGSLQYEQQVTQTMPLEYYQRENESVASAVPDVSSARLPMFMEGKITEEATVDEVSEKTSQRDSAPSTWQEESRPGRQEVDGRSEREPQEDVTRKETAKSQSLLNSGKPAKELRPVAMQSDILQDQQNRTQLTDKPENLSKKIGGIGEYDESHTRREPFLNKPTPPERPLLGPERHSGQDLKRRPAEQASCQRVMDCLHKCFEKLEEIQNSPDHNVLGNALCECYPQRRDSVDGRPPEPVICKCSEQQGKPQSDTPLDPTAPLKSPADKSGSVASKKPKTRNPGLSQPDSPGKPSTLPKGQPTKTEFVAFKQQQTSGSFGSFGKRPAVPKEQLTKTESRPPSSGISGGQPDSTTIQATPNRQDSSLYKQECVKIQQPLHEWKYTRDATPLKPGQLVPQESTTMCIPSKQSEINKLSQSEGTSKQQEPSEFSTTEIVTPRESVLKSAPKQEPSFKQAVSQQGWALQKSASGASKTALSSDRTLGGAPKSDILKPSKAPSKLALPRPQASVTETSPQIPDNENHPWRELDSGKDLQRIASTGKSTATEETPDKKGAAEIGRPLEQTYKAKPRDKEISPPIKSDQEKRLSADGSQSSSLGKQSSISDEKSSLSASSEKTEPSEKPATGGEKPLSYCLQAYYLPLYQCAVCQQITPYPLSCQMGLAQACCPSPYDPCQCQPCYPSSLPLCLPCPSQGYLLPYPLPCPSEQSEPDQHPQSNKFQPYQPDSPLPHSSRQTCCEPSEPCPQSNLQLGSEPAEPNKKREDPDEQNSVKERSKRDRSNRAEMGKVSKSTEACLPPCFEQAEPCQQPCLKPAETCPDSSQQPCSQSSYRQSNQHLISEPVKLYPEPGRKQEPPENRTDIKEMLKKDRGKAAKLDGESKPAEPCQQPCCKPVVQLCPQSNQQLCPEPESCCEPSKKQKYLEKKQSDVAANSNRDKGKPKLNDTPKPSEPCQEPCQCCPLSCPSSALCLTNSNSSICPAGLCQPCEDNETGGGKNKQDSIHSNQSDIQSYKSRLTGMPVSSSEIKDGEEYIYEKSKGGDKIRSTADGPSNTNEIRTRGTNKKQKGSEKENYPKENLKRGEGKTRKLDEESDTEFEWRQKSGKDQEHNEMLQRESESRKWSSEREGNGKTTPDKRGISRRKQANDSSEETRWEGSGIKLQRSPHRPASAKSGSSATSKLTTSEEGKSRKRRVDVESHFGRRTDTKITPAVEWGSRRKTDRSLGQIIFERPVVGPTGSYKGAGRVPHYQLSPAFQATLSKSMLRRLELGQTKKPLPPVEKIVKPKKDSARIDRISLNPPCPVSGEQVLDAREGVSRWPPSIIQDRFNQKRTAQHHQKHAPNEPRCSFTGSNDETSQKSTTETKDAQYSYIPSLVEASCASNETFRSRSQRYPYSDSEKRRNVFSPYYLTPTGAPHRAIGSSKRHKVTKRLQQSNQTTLSPPEFSQQKRPKGRDLPPSSSSSSSSNAEDSVSFQSEDPNCGSWQESQCSCPEWINGVSFPEYHNCCAHVWANAPHCICPLHPHHVCLKASCPPPGRRRHMKAKPLSLRSQRTGFILLRGRLHPGEQKPR